MDINARSRSELKSYFVRNAIPTEGNFADLVDGMINQQDDRIVKQPDGPLSLEAAGANETSQKPVLHFYRDFDSNTADWILNLQPRVDATPEGSRAGLTIADGSGNSRLFIEQNSGRVGLGTIEPTQELHIVAAGQNAEIRLQQAGQEPIDLFSGTDRAGLWSYGNKALTLGTNNAERVRITEAGNVGIGTNVPNRPLTVFRQGAAYQNVRDGTREILMGVDGNGGIVSVMTDHPLIFRSGGNAERMRIAPNGRVGIGTSNPTDKLSVHDGDISISGGRYRRLKIVSDEYWAGIELVARNAGENGRPHIDFTIGELGDPNFGIRLSAPNNNALVLDGGSLGIGASPAEKLHVNGSIRLNGRISTTNAWGTDIGGTKAPSSVVRVGELWSWAGIFGRNGLKLGSSNSRILYRGTFGKESSRTLKEEIQEMPIDMALDVLRGLNPVTYLLKSDASMQTHAGFIAEDVPDLIATAGRQAIVEHHIVTILTKVVQEQQKTIAELKARLGMT